jgi:hypothetical protein
VRLQAGSTGTTAGIVLILQQADVTKIGLRPFNGWREMYLGPNAKVRWRF